MRVLLMLTAGALVLLLVNGTVRGPGADVAGLRHAASTPVSAEQRRAIPRDSAPGKVALPYVSVDVREPALRGRTVRVASGESLQAALDAASPGDRLVLDAGAVYEGPFRLPWKNGDEWISIRSSALRELPPGRRVNPSDAQHMPRLTAAAEAVFTAAPGAHHYRLEGVEIAPAPGRFLYTLVELGSSGANLTELPHHIVIDRAYIHGDHRRGGRRGVALNGRMLAVVNSYVSDFKEVGADSQAIAGWNGPGPFRIENNYLEGAGENVMFGGADPSIFGLVPSDIEVLRNHFSKPLSWRIGHPTYEGTPWAVKNIFELKNARRVLVEGNLFQHNWVHAQNGFGILFTVRNQDGAAPWSVVEDVTFRNNVLHRTAAGFNILGRDDIHSSQQTSRILIENNLLTEIGGDWGGNGRLFQLLSGTADVSIIGNTAEQVSGGVVFGGDDEPHVRFAFRRNVVPDNGAGFLGSDAGVGRGAIARYFPDADISGNVFLDGRPSDYPGGNFFSAGDRGASEAGANVPALRALMQQVASWPF